MTAAATSGEGELTDGLLMLIAFRNIRERNQAVVLKDEDRSAGGSVSAGRIAAEDQKPALDDCRGHCPHAGDDPCFGHEIGRQRIGNANDVISIRRGTEEIVVLEFEPWI